MPGRLGISLSSSVGNPRSIPDPLCTTGNQLLVPGSLRMSLTSLRPCGYIPDRVGVESYHNRGLFTLSRGTIVSCLRSEASWERSGFDPKPGSGFHCPTHYSCFFHRLSRIKDPRKNRGLILWWNRGITNLKYWMYTLSYFAYDNIFLLMLVYKIMYSTVKRNLNP